MKRLRLAVVGFGALGRTCVREVGEAGDLELAGVVQRAPDTPEVPRGEVPVAGHLRDLGQVGAVLLCVPPDAASGVAHEILQQRLPLVECARLEGAARERHYLGLDQAARHHRVAAIVGAGWDPGVLPLLRRLFEVLIPHGRTVSGLHPGVSAHHTATVAGIPGVSAALALEQRSAEGRAQRYVYAQLEPGTKEQAVQRALEADPLFAGTELHLFAVPDLAALEAAGSGIVVERRATASAGRHENLLFEARFDPVNFAARVMLDAARSLAGLRPGAHRYALR